MDWMVKMSIDENKLGENIKSLRKAFAETQLELSIAIGIDSPNTISNYEKGIRYPEATIRTKIAKHYRITEDQLASSDFSNLKLSSTSFNLSSLNKLTIKLFPVFKLDDSIKSDDFNKGLNAHKRIRSMMLNGEEIDELDLEVCIESYYNAYEHCKISEGIANLLGYCILLESSIKDFEMQEVGKELLNNSRNKRIHLKELYLKDTSGINDQRRDDTEVEFADELEKMIRELFQILKKEKKFRELTYYYTALRYAGGCIENNLSSEMNRMVGFEMLSSFKKMGNRYARKFYNLYRDL